MKEIHFIWTSQLDSTFERKRVDFAKRVSLERKWVNSVHGLVLYNSS